MRRLHLLAVPLLVAGIALTLVACSDDGDSGGGDGGDRNQTIAGMIDSGDAPDGEELYIESCSTCHGTEGQGGIGPQLTGIADRMSLPDHIDVVLNGRGGMPNFSSTLDDETIAAIVAYEREGLG